MMKLLRRGLAVLLSIALVFSLVAVVATPNWSNATSLGLLSRYYETGNTDTDVAAAKMISTVDGDPGGKSYGVYMFASKTGSVKAFIEWCRNTTINAANTVAYAIGEKLATAYYSNGEGCGPLFDQAWLSAGDEYGSAFFTVQEAYAKTQIYDKAISLITATPEGYYFNIDNYSVALKNVIWSRAVHHGPSGACNIVVRAFNALGGFANQSESDLIMAIYNESGRVVTPQELYAENGAAAETMNGTLAAKYDADGKILRYWYGSSPGVQLAVYRRLNVYEPSDALSMLQKNAFSTTTLSEGNYQIRLKKDNATLALGVADNGVKLVNTGGDTPAAAAKFTLHYLSGIGAYTMNTVVGETPMRLTAGTANSEGFGTVSLAAPSYSDTQLWYIEQTPEGQMLKNKATGTYLSFRNDTLVMVGTEGASVTVTANGVSSDNDTVETFTQALPEGSSATPKTLSVTFVTGENGSIAENSTAVFETGTSSDFVAKTLHAVSAKEGWTFVGWFTEDGFEVKPGAIGAAGNLTLYARYTTSAAVTPFLWEFSSVVADVSDFAVHHLIYPDQNTELHHKDSGFPVHGMISCSGKITNVTVKVNGPKPLTASTTPNASSYNLNGLDSAMAYSSLTQGDYTYTLTATVNGVTYTLQKSSFSVGAQVEKPADSDKVTVTFDAGENGTCLTSSKTYSLDSVVYGELPSVVPKSGWGFAGWFTEDGVQILPGTQIVAENITLYAKYTKIHTYTFLKASSGIFASGSAAAGTVFLVPSGVPIKNPDSQYTYTFSHWMDDAGNKYSSGQPIVMPECDLTFTPVYSQRPFTGGSVGGDGGGGGSTDTGGNSGTGGGTTSVPSSGSVWKLTPGVTVSQVEGTVYSGNTVVTSGNLATGMTVQSGTASFTIAIIGDISGDGRVTISDVVQVQSYLLNKKQLSGAYLEAADLNRDERVTITDLVKVARVVAGKDTIR